MITLQLETPLPYWVDPYPENAAQSLLANLPAHTCHALIDMAFKPGLHEQWVQHFPTLEMHSLFAGKFEGVGLAELSPHLLTLPQAPEQRRQVIDFLLHHTRGTPMLSFVASPHGGLLKHLQQQLDAQNPEGEGFVMRLADSRALHALLQVLTAEQRQRLLLPGMQWWYWKMDGEQVQVDSDAEPTGEAQTGPYRFSDEQISQLIALSQPGKWLRVIEQHPQHFGHLTGTPSQVCECLREVLQREESRQLHDAELLNIFKTALLQAALVTVASKHGTLNE
ncbi:DUF4123 domain-containing protein [Pseudomonas putida]|uniref:DUF4123 domain-containing protein n=1 Tax=Pseudomonas putida TaxID=303 RepID=UPI002363E440|nr:DUF4123 domain-containing protein [Pseudomonas putida]MDD1965957.1 DUF4123 domain-containing protein [Pseudomonas putida]